MQPSNTAPAAPPNAPPKGFTVASVMRRSGKQILQGLGHNDQPNAPVRLDTYTQTPESCVARITIGDDTAVLKAFNPSRPEASYLLDREVSIYRALANAGLSPDLRAYSEGHGFLILSHVAGRTLLDHVNDTNLPHVAWRLGAWFRSFMARLPTSPAEGATWGSYLAAYEGLFTDAEMAEFGPFFATLPIREKGIAKNDAVLRNFLLGEDDRLLGIDYAQASLKPAGWDLLLTARILTQSFPDKTTEIVAGLMRGWNGNVAGISAKDFGRLAVIFAAATATRRPGQNGPLAERFTSAYTAQSAQDKSLPRIAQSYRIPSLGTAMGALDPGQVDGLRAALTAMAQAALAMPLPDTPDLPIGETRALSPVMAAACATCKGLCCASGLDAHAHLTPDTLNRLRAASPDMTVQDIVGYYLSKLPDTHADESCLFNGPTGCTLPRAARATRCNTYLCRSGKMIEAAPEAVRTAQAPVLLIAIDDNTVERASVVTQDRVQTLDPSRFDVT